MKVRNGFVSNSSSSSFIVIGEILSSWSTIAKRITDKKNVAVIGWGMGSSGDCESDFFYIKKAYIPTLKKFYENNPDSITIIDVEQLICTECNSKIEPVLQEKDIITFRKDYNTCENLEQVKRRYKI